MNNQLELLILLYKEEKIQLQKLIDDCLVETEYLMAHYYSKALGQINRRLQTLNTIDDKLYDEKNYRQIIINGLEKKIESESSEYMKKFYIKDLQRVKNELEKLNQIPKQPTLKENFTILDETLKKLSEKKIKNLKLILKKADNLFLAFSYSKKTLKVTVPYIKQHKKKWILSNGNINSFKKLGFYLTENENKLSLIFIGEMEEILTKLKIILSKIIFEIFFFKEFDNESYIQFTEKASL